jgi:hypothetical protein
MPHEGAVGNVLVAKTCSTRKRADIEIGHYSAALPHRPRASIGVVSSEQPPAELDFNLWTGPAPEHPYRTNLVPYNWHWIWDFGNGEIGNLGTHQMDLARWAMPVDAAPQSVISLGGRFGYQDQGRTPNTQLTAFDFGDVKLLTRPYRPPFIVPEQV